MAGFNLPNVSTPDIIAGNYATANLQNQQANLLVPAQAAQAQAGAGLATAQTGLVGAQTTGANLANQSATIDLQSRLATMKAFRQAYSETNGVPMPGATTPAAPNEQTTIQSQPAVAPGTPAAAANAAPGAPTGQSGANAIAAMATPVTAIASPAAAARGQATQAAGANIDQTSPTAVGEHAATTEYTSNGTPNTLSDSFLTKVRDLSIANGADPVQANAAFIAGQNTRLDMTKKFADIAKLQAEGAISAETAQQQHLDTVNDMAHQASILLANNPIKAQAIAQSIGIDTSTSAGLAQLKAMSDSSPKGQAEQKQMNDNANIANEIKNRDLQTAISQGQLRVAQANSATARGELTNNQQKTIIAQNEQGVQMMKGATLSASQVDQSRQLQDDIATLQDIYKSGKATQKEGIYLVAADSLPPGKLKVFTDAGMKVNNGMLDVASLMSRIKGAAGELKTVNLGANGATGAGGGAELMKTMEQSITGTGLKADQPITAVLNSLNSVKQFAHSTEEHAQGSLSGYNNYLDQNGGKIFHSVQPAYTRKTPPAIGDIVLFPDGIKRAYMGGEAANINNWKK